MARKEAGDLSTLVVEGLPVEEVSGAGGVAGVMIIGVLPISSHLDPLAILGNWQCCGRSSWCPWEIGICK